MVVETAGVDRAKKSAATSLGERDARVSRTKVEIIPSEKGANREGGYLGEKSQIAGVA